jgi:hypothetical protein
MKHENRIFFNPVNSKITFSPTIMDTGTFRRIHCRYGNLSLKQFASILQLLTHPYPSVPSVLILLMFFLPHLHRSTYGIKSIGGLLTVPGRSSVILATGPVLLQPFSILPFNSSNILPIIGLGNPINPTLF